ncbi:hypothetical protein LSAT2_003826 [Lamellibrachia satsuma]|nr:hypothetical protein LSAT2_003826 [Lamellibrachia satsuma]
MDAMGFGMGCCCLQVTFQACNITEGETALRSAGTVVSNPFGLECSLPHTERLLDRRRLSVEHHRSVSG